MPAYNSTTTSTGGETRCDAKRTYRREADAKAERRRMWKSVIDPFRVEVYWCGRHKGWHLGNRPLF